MSFWEKGELVIFVARSSKSENSPPWRGELHFCEDELPKKSTWWLSYWWPHVY